MAETKLSLCTEDYLHLSRMTMDYKFCEAKKKGELKPWTPSQMERSLRRILVDYGWGIKKKPENSC